MRRLIDPRTLPATGAWREGDPPGARKFADIGTLPLDAGTDLSVTMAYETWGTLNSDASNAVLVLHALTGDSHVVGAAGEGHPTGGWWEDVVGPGRAIDTNRWFVVAPNILGGCQGTTGPASIAPDGVPWGSRFPFVTARDQASAEALLADQLGIRRFAMVIGSSMGGQRALEWAVMFPERVARLAVIASNAATTAHQLALAHTQLLAIEGDPNFNCGDYYDAPLGHGPAAGLALARQIAHISYRSTAELAGRFSRLPQHAEEPLLGGRYAVESYLDHAGWKLARRFDANSYRVITRAMMTHDLGRNRGGADIALSQITARVMVVGVDTDELFLPEELERIVRHAPKAVPLRWISSPHGHDGFLVQHDQVSEHVERFLLTRASSRAWK
ncbi:MAG TPA: homoserine O-acetyltransferase [Actinomycetaceae bacterium]|nr:homoserine O-acetyltransferase [Actinomycetaceae bacterium]